MQSFIEKLQSLIPENSERHSFFQLKHFIISKEPTVQGKLQACIRELNSRKNELQAIEVELADEHDNKRLLEIRMERPRKDTERNDILKRKLKRQLMAKDARIQYLRKRLKSVEQEAHFILEIYEWLLTQEPLKDWDDFKVQGDYWNQKLLNELHVKLILTNSIDTELIHSILAMPENSPVKAEMLKLYSNRVQSLQIDKKKEDQKQQIEEKKDT